MLASLLFFHATFSEVSNCGLGKLSQSDEKKSVKYVNSWLELSAIKYSDDKELLEVTPLTENLAQAVFTQKEDRCGGFHRNTQGKYCRSPTPPLAPFNSFFLFIVTLYAWVTALARLTMLKDMQKLQNMGARVFYTDTDSIIFDVPKKVGKDTLVSEFKIGSKAYGGYKFEVGGDISSCVVAGPKNYAIRYLDLKKGTEEEMVKVRGFTLTNPSAIQKLNHATMKETLAKWWIRGEVETIETENFSMKVDRKKLSVKNTCVIKKYRNDNFDKRWIDQKTLEKNKCLATIPFGAKHADYADIPSNLCK